jgi:hypothetical protein
MSPLRLSSLLASALIAGVTLFTAGCGTDHARVRIVHASPDAPNVDVLLDGKKVLTNVAYETASSYLKVKAGSRKVEVRATGTTTDAISTTASVVANKDYTVLAVDKVASIYALVAEDDNTAPASGMVKLRVIHASPTAQTLANVDVYLVAPGTDITTLTPAISNISFKTISSYLSVAPGSYEAIVTLTGAKSPRYIDVSGLTFAAGQIRTIVALDAPGGGTPLTAVVLNDLN